MSTEFETGISSLTADTITAGTVQVNDNSSMVFTSNGTLTSSGATYYITAGDSITFTTSEEPMYTLARKMPYLTDGFYVNSGANGSLKIISRDILTRRKR